MPAERRIRTRTSEWARISERINVAMDLTSRPNGLRFCDIQSRTALLTELTAAGRCVPGGEPVGATS